MVILGQITAWGEARRLRGGDRRPDHAHTGLRHDGTSPTPFVTRREGRVSEAHIDPSRCP